MQQQIEAEISQVQETMEVYVILLQQQKHDIHVIQLQTDQQV